MHEQLESLRRVSSVDDLVRLSATVRTHAAVLDEASLTDKHIDYALAQRASQVIVSLIDRADELDNVGRSWVAAAAQYFILTDDQWRDLGVHGVRDDAAAVRWVCDTVGYADLAAALDTQRQ